MHGRKYWLEEIVIRMHVDHGVASYKFRAGVGVVRLPQVIRFSSHSLCNYLY